MPPFAAVYFATRKCLAGSLSQSSTSPTVSVPQEENEEMELQVHRPCELVSFGKVSHCSPPQGQVLCPPACSFGDGQCWPHLLISQYLSQHRATCKVREARAFIATELSPIYVLYSTHGNGGTGTARKVSAEDRTTKKHRMFGVGRDI